MSAFLFSPNGNLHVIPASDKWQRQDLLNCLSGGNEVLCSGSVYISLNGRLLQPCDQNTLSIATNDVVRVNYRLPGGKGGFGSMLRAIGAQIEKTTSREACRDLSGRRMRDVNDEKKITEWVAKQADRERELAKQKQERLERRRAAPKHNFDDRSYTRQIQENLEKIDDALKQGFKVSTSASGSLVGVKRTSTMSGAVPKKSKMWMDVDEEELDDSDYETLQNQRLTDQSSSSMSTSSTSTITSNTTTNAADVSGKGHSRDERLTDQPSSSTDTSKIGTEPISSTDTLSESNSGDEVLMSKPSTSIGTRTVTTSVSSHTDSSAEGNTSDKHMLQGNATEPTMLGEEKPKDKITSKNNSNGCSANDSPRDIKPFNINDYNTAQELETIGLEPLKEHLKALGLKCGGTLQERAQRLFTTKGKALEDLDPSLFAKPSKGKNKPRKK